MIAHPLESDMPGRLVLGMDEAGRGPIAGPLVVAGVILPPDLFHAGLDDSKKLSEKKREAMYQEILDMALWCMILVVPEQEIDRLNIYRATQKAMEEIAQAALAAFPELVIWTDAMKLTNGAAHTAIIKGDAKSLNIAAASILAKVYRDGIMKELDREYPQYGLKQHKGYPTKAHLAALRQYGPQEFHRRSYRPVAELEESRLFD